MADEEERLMPARWEAFDDEALRRVHRALLDGVRPAEKLAAMRFMLPAMNAAERAELLAGRGRFHLVVAGEAGLGERDSA